MEMYFCQFNMDTGCVEAWLRNGKILSIDCSTVEKVYAKTMQQRSELDWLIYNDPAAYVDLITEGDVQKYLETVTDYRPLNDVQ